MTTMTSRHFRRTGLATSWKARIRTRSDSRWNSQVANSGFMSLLNFSKIIARFITSLSIWLPVAIHLSKRLTIVINYSRRISSQYYSRVRNYDRYGFYEANQRIEIFICVCKTSFAIGKRECWYKNSFMIFLIIFTFQVGIIFSLWALAPILFTYGMFFCIAWWDVVIVVAENT